MSNQTAKESNISVEQCEAIHAKLDAISKKIDYTRWFIAGFIFGVFAFCVFYFMT